MTPTPADALAIWNAGVDAVRPEVLLPGFLRHDADFRTAMEQADRILVVGGGKAGTAMAAAFEEALPEFLPKITGLVNVPANAVRPLRAIETHKGRPAGSNHPTAIGVAGVERMLELLRGAGPGDVAVCLLSGGGSALLPAPDGITLAAKQAVTRLLHGCGATINEMNCVRKHLSRVKGGRMAQAFSGRRLFSLIISDVVGDPLDVIASGPTAVDPTTFADAFAVIEKYRLVNVAPAEVYDRLRIGAAGSLPETMKELPPNVRNVLLGNNAVAVAAAAREATARGHEVFLLGSHIEGETRRAAEKMAERVRQTHPGGKPVCLLSGGETTVTLGPHPGKGGRNQEFVLAMALSLGDEGMANTVVLSGGTDGEDGPTDAAGAVADATTLPRLRQAGADPAEALRKHSSYDLFHSVDALVKTGPTHTNVMDLRVILIGGN